MARLLLWACLAVLAIACDAAIATPQPNQPAWTPPPDWVIAVASGGAFQLAMPPTLHAANDPVAIFANEAPPGPGREIPFQLMALGPSADDQPAPGQDLAAWIGARLADPGQGVPSVTRVILPAGPAVRYERADRVGTPHAWHFVVFAIVTPRGVAYLQLDGPDAVWPAHASFPDLVALTLRFR